MKNALTKVESKDLLPGDIFWFSGYWCTFTRFVGDKVYGKFPYTPDNMGDQCMLRHASPLYLQKYGPHMLAIKARS